MIAPRASERFALCQEAAYYESATRLGRDDFHVLRAGVNYHF